MAEINLMSEDRFLAIEAVTPVLQPLLIRAGWYLFQVSKRIGGGEAWIWRNDVSLSAIVAFSGSTTLVDFAKDLRAGISCPSPHGLGHIHKGICDHYVYDPPLPDNKLAGFTKVIATGHSLGAAHAVMYSKQFRDIDRLITFGCPRFGDFEYVTDITVIHERYIHFLNMYSKGPRGKSAFKAVVQDLVTRIPPWGSEFPGSIFTKSKIMTTTSGWYVLSDAISGLTKGIIIHNIKNYAKSDKLDKYGALDGNNLQ